eukprot:1178347-Rhodomonas_salina.1
MGWAGNTIHWGGQCHARAQHSPSASLGAQPHRPPPRPRSESSAPPSSSRHPARSVMLCPE